MLTERQLSIVTKYMREGLEAKARGMECIFVINSKGEIAYHEDTIPNQLWNHDMLQLAGRAWMHGYHPVDPAELTRFLSIQAVLGMQRTANVVNQWARAMSPYEMRETMRLLNEVDYATAVRRGRRMLMEFETASTTNNSI